MREPIAGHSTSTLLEWDAKTFTWLCECGKENTEPQPASGPPVPTRCKAA